MRSGLGGRRLGQAGSQRSVSLRWRWLGAPENLVLKIGVHRGPSMVVTVNDHVDYFGRSVNIAAREQGLADANEVYLTADVYYSPGVARALEAQQVALDEVMGKRVSERLRVYQVARATG